MTKAKNLLNVKEVAKLLGLHDQTIYDLCKNNEIPHLKIGKTQRAIRFDAEDVDKWLDERKQKVCKNIVLEPVMAFSPKEHDKTFLRSVSMSGKNGLRHWNYGFGGIMQRETKGGLIRYDIWYYDEHRKIRQEVVKMAICKKEAMEALTYRRRQIHKKQYSDQQDRQTISFKDYCEKYLKEIEMRNLKSRKMIELAVRKRFIPFFGDMTLSSITTGKVKDYILERKSTKARGKNQAVTNSSLNIELSYLRTIFNSGIEEEEYAIQKNPVKSALFLKDDRKKKDKVLTVEEEEKLLSASISHLRPIIICAINTGMRKSEVSTLEWKNVDLKQRTITVTAEHSKNGKPREIPINTILLEELKVLKANNGHSPFVFVYEKKRGDIRPVGDFKIAWMKAIEKAGISNFTFHQLRHTFASRLAEQGVHPFQAKKILGHSSIDMTEWYSHFNQKQLLEAVEKVNGNGKSSGVFEESQARG